MTLKKFQKAYSTKRCFEIKEQQLKVASSAKFSLLCNENLLG